MTFADWLFFAVGINIVVFIPIWIPVIILVVVAKSRNRSPAYGWWGLMSYFGMIIGLILILAKDPLAKQLPRGHYYEPVLDPVAAPDDRGHQT